MGRSRVPESEARLRWRQFEIEMASERVRTREPERARLEEERARIAAELAQITASEDARLSAIRHKRLVLAGTAAAGLGVVAARISRKRG